MPILLSDVNSCNSDLGRILYANPNEWDVHLNIINTKTVSTFFTSHTEYEMALCAIPCNSVAADIRFFEMWTRFRDVKRLWEQLGDLHKKLHLHGSFPQFAEGVIFGNQSAQVVGKRTLSITTFMNYILNHRVLRQSKSLQDYFDKAHEILEYKDLLDPVQQSHSNDDSTATSFGSMIHVSKYNAQDPRLFFISEREQEHEHEGSLPVIPPHRESTLSHFDPTIPQPGPNPDLTTQLYFQTCPIFSTLTQESSTLNAQTNNNLTNTTSLPRNNNTSGMMNQTSTSQSSYVLPTYYCVTLSQQPQFTHFSQVNDDPLQQDYS
ncbi:PX domain-containing protein [Wuchereria bancrofti]|uniref:PX domain-containing protein n=1 Tax=Wuchereria bancrofti TaxID=6293 RepID=J9B7R3_WUCBA|nr:PX domain-containing protein [Wuchereria bancrofti]VDM12550.1 unnamed protein product [Wuchereria bancrofti]